MLDLALQLARETKDLELTQMVEHVAKLERSKFTDVVWKRELGPKGDVLPFAVGRLTQNLEPVARKRAARADTWRKIFARLARAKGVTHSFTRRAFTGEDGAVWVTGWFEHPKFARLLMFGRVIAPGDPDLRRHVVPTAMRDACYKEASGRVDSGWSFAIEVGDLGDTTPRWTSIVPSTATKRRARADVKKQFAEAKKVIRSAIERKTNLESFVSHFVAYLLHVGHGELEGRRWAESARVFFGLAAFPGPELTGANAHRSASSVDLQDEINTLRGNVRAARKLIAGWRRIGQP